MSDANARQFGGNHYKGLEYQHWDFAADASLPYHEGQITKYATRHRRKGGKVDAEKCCHFLEKLRELAVEGRRYPLAADEHRNALADKFLKHHQQRFGELTEDEQTVVFKTTNWNGTADLDEAICAARRIVVGYDSQSD